MAHAPTTTLAPRTGASAASASGHVLAVHRGRVGRVLAVAVVRRGGVRGPRARAAAVVAVDLVVGDRVEREQRVVAGTPDHAAAPGGGWRQAIVARPALQDVVEAPIRVQAAGHDVVAAVAEEVVRPR